MHRLGLRFRWVGWGLLGVLIVTGALMLGMRGYTWAHLWDGTLWAGAWGHVIERENLSLVNASLSDAAGARSRFGLVVLYRMLCD